MAWGGGVRRHGHGENFKISESKKKQPKLNYPASENFPHPLDAAVKVDPIPKHKAVGGDKGGWGD